MSNSENHQSSLEITKYPIENDSSNNPPNSEGFLFLELPDLNSLLYLGGSSPDSFGLYLFDINNSTWLKSSLRAIFSHQCHTLQGGMIHHFYLFMVVNLFKKVKINHSKKPI